MPASPPVSAFSPQELWYWNGVSLNQPWFNISTFGGSRFGTPTLRGTDIPVPYRAGQSYRGTKYPDARTITLTMWLDGSGSANQAYPSVDSRLAFNDNWQQLRSTFFARGGGGSVQGQLQRNWYWTQGGTAQLVTSTAMAELAGSMDLTMSGRTGAAFAVDVNLSDPYFYGAQRTQAITSGGGTIIAYGEGLVGEGWASPVSSFTVVLSAAATVTNTTLGISFTVASGPSFPVTVDILNGLVTDSGGVNQIAKLTHVGSRAWMVLNEGSNVITCSAGTATFSWMDAYV